MARLPVLAFRAKNYFSYCILGREKINAWRARGGRARDSVNFRKFSPCIARARGAPARV
jgi:hypothetical protein